MTFPGLDGFIDLRHPTTLLHPFLFIAHIGRVFYHNMPKKKYYAVAVGRKVGVFDTWDECKEQTNGFSGAVFKSFGSKGDAEGFVQSRLSSRKSQAVATQPKKRKEAPQDSPAESTARPPKVSSKSKSANGAFNDIVNKVPPGSTAIEVSFDGGARGNPGVAGCGADIILRTTKPRSNETVRTVYHIRRFLATKSTNNHAEYCGMISALDYILKLISMPKNDCLLQSLVIRGDSMLVIQQMNGLWTSNELNYLYIVAKDLVGRIVHETGMAPSSVVFEHVRRQYNAIADRLANEAMDATRSWISIKDSNGEETNESVPDIDPSIYSETPDTKRRR
eukprot:Nitzschia sp. Nitz4//scaffold27_size158506//132088//133248//NITZ4_002620-RA/size158506-snap-gene-0.205-mRNA-1//1//CDS//3329545548//4832//frame0